MEQTRLNVRFGTPIGEPNWSAAILGGTESGVNRCRKRDILMPPGSRRSGSAPTCASGLQAQNWSAASLAAANLRLKFAQTKDRQIDLPVLSAFRSVGL
jgi:hypothetical protein